MVPGNPLDCVRALGYRARTAINSRPGSDAAAFAFHMAQAIKLDIRLPHQHNL
jgi:hypothetical protein